MKKFYIKAILDSFKMLLVIMACIVFMFVIGVPIYFVIYVLVTLIAKYWQISAIPAGIIMVIWYAYYIHKRALKLKKWSAWAKAEREKSLTETERLAGKVDSKKVSNNQHMAQH